jgi:hypothetical protein
LTINFEVDPLPGAEKTALDSLVANFGNPDNANIFTQWIRTSVEATTQGSTAVAPNLFGASKGDSAGGGLKLINLSVPLASSGCGLHPVKSTARTAKLQAGVAMDSTQALQLGLSSSTTVDLEVSGAGGLDAGSLAASTWYYTYVITDGDPLAPTVDTLASTSDTSPTLPGAFTHFVRTGAVLTNGSSNIHDFVSHQYGKMLVVEWLDERSNAPFLVLEDGDQTSTTAIDLSGVVPATATMFRFAASTWSSTTGYIHISGEGTSFGRVIVRSQGDVATDISVVNREIEYCMASSGGALDIYATGYVDRRWD